jgi:hypothetical protein
VLTPAEHLTSPEPRPDPGIERRFYRRVAPSGLISVAFAGGNLGMLLNLSENGLLVSTPLALTQNFVCRTSLLLNGLTNAIDVYARVVWTSDSHRAGIQFLDLTDHDRERIRKWAEIEEAHDPGGQQNDSPQPNDAAPAAGSNGKTPPNIKISRIQLLAGIAAALAMLAMAVALRGTSHSSLPGTLPFTWKNLLAMQPGGAAWGQPLDKPASAVPSPAQNKSAAQFVSPGHVAPAPVPSATNQNAAPSSATNGNGSRAENTPTEKPSLANTKPAAKTAKPAAPKTDPLPFRAHNAAKTRVRNPAILTAQNHFGNQYVGHLDLADAGANNSAPNDSAAKENASTTTPPPNAAAPAAANEAAKNASLFAATPGNAHAPSQASAIAGSISGKNAPNPAPEEDVPANLALLNSAAASSASTNSSPTSSEARAASPALADPRISASVSSAPLNPSNANPAAAARGSSIAAPNSANAVPPAPANHLWQITLPTNGRASFINLPGEQLLQSPAVTMHVQRSVLAPATAASVTPGTTTTAANAPRTESVRVGELLSHVEPRTPRLTEETGARVSVRAYLGADGRVERLVPVNGSVALVSSAARAVREWRFAPTLLGGKPVQTSAYVVVEFHPQNDGSANP